MAFWISGILVLWLPYCFTVVKLWQSDDQLIVGASKHWAWLSATTDDQLTFETCKKLYWVVCAKFCMHLWGLRTPHWPSFVFPCSTPDVISVLGQVHVAWLECAKRGGLVGPIRCMGWRFPTVALNCSLDFSIAGLTRTCEVPMCTSIDKIFAFWDLSSLCNTVVTHVSVKHTEKITVYLCLHC